MNNEIIIKENQKLLLPILWLGKETSLSYNIHLQGSGAKITFLALLLGKKMSKLDLKINICHQKPDTESKIIIKGALNDNANVNFDGLVKIQSGAKYSNTHLSAHILLLSDNAKGQISPGLEISEKDIKAGHAATIGRINDLELFYLMSRGLSEKTGKSLIVQGFLESILREFPDKLAHQAQKELASFTS